jgi:hypothetical protein
VEGIWEGMKKRRGEERERWRVGEGDEMGDGKKCGGEERRVRMRRAGRAVDGLRVRVEVERD